MKRQAPARRWSQGDAPYEIGYGKPPKHTQFKPGQSGNSKGRPRGQRNFRTAVRDALKRKSPSGRATGHARSQNGAIIRDLQQSSQEDAKALLAFISWPDAGLMDEL